MVDAVSCKVFCHLGETAAPPAVIVFFHYFPIIGWESPVLSVDRERIGRSTCLTVEVEIMGFYPGFYAGTADTDGDVTFQQNAFCSGIRTNGKQLHVQLVLQVIVEGDFGIGFVFRRTQSGYFIGIVSRIFRPVIEIRCAIRVAQVAESRIRLKPFLIMPEEVQEIFRGKYFFPFHLVYFSQVVHLQLVSLLIIHHGKGIHFDACFFERFCGFLVLQGWELAKVDVHRVKSVDGDAVIRIRVSPRTTHSRIIDGKNLNGFLSGLICPVGQ